MVAVVDSGVDYNHEDLKNVMWDQGNTISSLKAMGGGTYGYNPAATDPAKTSDPMDTTIGHGTHCAGIIASQWNNSLGVAGAVKNCRIMAVRMFRDDGTGDMAAAIKCYAYIQEAKKSGVNVVAVNDSWGSLAYNVPNNHSVTTAIDTVGKLGVVSCFAANNLSANNDLNVGSVIDSPYAVTVGANDSQGYPSYFSCYGKRTVDVFAPGSQILSTVTTNTDTVTMDKHAMPLQYLPRIQDPADSAFYENFETSAPPAVTMQLYDQNGSLVPSAVQSTLTPGYTSNTGSQLSLASIANDQNFSIQFSFDAGKLSGLSADQDLYLAFQGSLGNACYGKSLNIQMLVNGQWTNIDSDNVSSGKAVPMRLRFTDHNWNISSGKLKNAGDLLNSKDAGGNIVLRLTGTMTDNNSDAVFRLDDFGVGTKPSNYSYADGTSMATPMITSEAALLSTVYTEAAGTTADNAAEIIARIRGGVNRSTAAATGLADKSASGGYADAGAAFTDPMPVVNDLSVKGTTATVSGYFFGTDTGTVTIAGQPAAVTSWSDRTITAAVPEGLDGTLEVVVTRSGGADQWGRDSFAIQPDYKGYTNLTPPDLSYGTFQGYPITSANGTPIAMAGAGHTILTFGIINDTSTNYMEAYDTQTGQWRKVTPPSKSTFGGNDLFYHLAGGKDKFYMLFTDKETSKVMLSTYDVASDTWSTVKTDSGLSGFEALVVYGDKLLAIGGDDQDSEGNFAAVATVRVMDPNTGEVTGTLPDMPEGRSGAIARASGDTLVIAGGCASGLKKTFGLPVTSYSSTLVFDGTQWTENTDTIFNSGGDNANFDLKQTLDFAVGAVDNGLIVAGPVKNLAVNTRGLTTAASSPMMDTWHMSQTGSGAVWSGDTELLFDTQKTTKNVGATLDGQFYVLGYREGVSGNLVFRSTPVAYTPPTGDPGTTGTGGDTQITTTLQSLNADTGIPGTSAGLAAAAILAAGAVIAAAWALRRKTRKS